MLAAAIIRDGITSVACRPNSASIDDGLAVATRDVENIGRLAEAGNPPAQCRDDSLPLLDRQSEMAGAGRQIGMMQVLGFDTNFDEGFHQFRKHGGIVIDALEQHRLADHGNAGIDETGAGCPRLGR